MKKIILVTGMHRSHTSLVSQWLNACDLSFGGNLMGADYANEKGYFEQLEIVAFHEQLLKNNNSHVYPEVIPDFNLRKGDTQQLQQIIEKMEGDDVAIKDPRACLFLENLWLDAFPDLTMVFTFRHPFEVIASSVKRQDKASKTQSFLQQQKWQLMKFKWVNRFADAYLMYNRAIMEVVKTNPNQCLLVDLVSCKQCGEEYISWLQERGFALQYQSVETVFSDTLTEPNHYKKQLSQATQKELLSVYEQLKALRSNCSAFDQ